MARAKGTAKPALPADLTEDKLLKMYRDVVMTRLLDERQWVLNRTGKAPFTIPCRGQEATQVGWAAALQENDFFVPYYRDLGVAVCAGMTPRELMLALFGKREDPASSGRQMPGHFGHRARRIIPGSSPVATQLLHAVGIAHAAKMRGQKVVAGTALGEGSTNQGEFHEALNWASVFRLPVLFVVENNGYAISVPQAKEMALQDVAERAQAYGMPGVSVDGNDLLAVYEAASEAVARARRGDGPTLLECKTYRTIPHSSDDDDRTYRSREEVAEWQKRDPVDRLRKFMRENGLISEQDDENLLRACKKEIDEATDYAEQASDPVPEDALLHVFAE